jgi:hypothetical protein
VEVTTRRASQSRDGLATREGKPLKAKAQRRYRIEIKPKRVRVEKGIKKLRKFEDAAQSSEVNSM